MSPEQSEIPRIEVSPDVRRGIEGFPSDIQEVFVHHNGMIKPVLAELMSLVGPVQVDEYVIQYLTRTHNVVNAHDPIPAPHRILPQRNLSREDAERLLFGQ